MNVFSHLWNLRNLNQSWMPTSTKADLLPLLSCAHFADRSVAASLISTYLLLTFSFAFAFAGYYFLINRGSQTFRHGLFGLSGFCFVLLLLFCRGLRGWCGSPFSQSTKQYTQSEISCARRQNVCVLVSRLFPPLFPRSPFLFSFLEKYHSDFSFKCNSEQESTKLCD